MKKEILILGQKKQDTLNYLGVRGFNQFDEEIKNNLYSSEQKVILDDVKKYITKKGMNKGGVMLEDQMEMFGYTDEGVQQEVDKLRRQEMLNLTKEITFMDAAKVCSRTKTCHR